MSEHELSLGDVHQSVDTSRHARGWKRLLSFIGPAYLVSVGYMDPGNWATDLQGGAQFGYRLIWVLLMSNLMALLLQNLSSRLGIIRKRDLAQVNRETYPPVVNFCLYLLAELAIAACDLAEVLGMAIGIQLLTGLPLIWGVSLTVLDTFLLFYLQKLGIRKMEAFIVSLILIIGLSFLAEIVLARPDWGQVAGGFVPSSLSKDALYIAVGIIGATVMPHNLYLHSALVQTRKVRQDKKSIREALRFNTIDTAVALNIAFLVNAAILILAAAVFHRAGRTEVARIEDAHQLLQPLLGSKIAPILFAVALIASGQSSTITGTLAGQIVMEGYLRLRINPLLRRLITRLIAIVPAVLTIALSGPQGLDKLLVLSQVLLSAQLGFAVIPLIHFVSDRKSMGEFVIGTPVKVLSWLVASVLIYLNVHMIWEQSATVFEPGGSWLVRAAILAGAAWFAWLFITMTVYPLLKRHTARIASPIHGIDQPLGNLAIPKKDHVAIALDFSGNDARLIASALAQGGKECTYHLIHVVETVSANYSGESAGDFETLTDEARLNAYAEQLRSMNYSAQTWLGYHNRIGEIVRLVKKTKADLVVLGAHRHTGIKDWIYGETVDKVRHKLSIPVLIVS